MSNKFEFSKDAELIEDELPQAWSFEDEPTLQGYFIGLEENIGVNNSTIYKFETADFGEVAVWQTAQLKRLLGKVKIGKPYEITFVGLGNLKNSDNKFKKFQVKKLTVKK